MHYASTTLVCLIGLVGCAAAPSPYGSFSVETPAGVDRTVVEDTVRQLTTVYPPANTRFALQQAAPDAFGQHLMASLRAKGYELQESAQESTKERPLRAEGAAATTGTAVPLRYVFDRAGDLYRLTLVMGTQSLTRAYLAQNGTVHPAGAWARKE